MEVRYKVQIQFTVNYSTVQLTEWSKELFSGQIHFTGSSNDMRKDFVLTCCLVTRSESLRVTFGLSIVKRLSQKVQIIYSFINHYKLQDMK